MSVGMRPRTNLPPDCDGTAVQFVRVPTTRAMGLIFLLRDAPNQRSNIQAQQGGKRWKSEAVRTVLAARGYQEKAVPLDVIRRIVEAGRLTGSAMNSQAWLLRNRNSQYL